MLRILLLALALGGVAAPLSALACDGPAGNSVAIASDGGKFVVTNTSRALVQVTFGAWSQTYSLSLAPGQSSTPATNGWLNLPMQGYQSCIAIALPSR